MRKISRFSAWAVLAVTLFVTLSPIGLRPHDILPVNVDRALAFALMGILFVTAYPRQWPWVALLVVVGAGAIELLQVLAPTRHAHVNDALVKGLGGIAGVFAGWLFERKGTAHVCTK